MRVLAELQGPERGHWPQLCPPMEVHAGACVSVCIHVILATLCDVPCGREHAAQLPQHSHMYKHHHFPAWFGRYAAKVYLKCVVVMHPLLPPMLAVSFDMSPYPPVALSCLAAMQTLAGC